MPSLALLHASQLVTLAGPLRARRGKELNELGIIPDGAFVAAGGKITHVGKSSEIEKLCDGQMEIIDARGYVVLPGFVDAHTHLVFAGNRLDDFEARARGETYEQIAAAGLFAMVGMQAFINIVVNLGLAPTKGMTLPFISYGGSSALAVALGMGMLLALTRRRGRDELA